MKAAAQPHHCGRELICFPSMLPYNKSRNLQVSSGYLVVHVNQHHTFYLKKDVLLSRCGLIMRLVKTAPVPKVHEHQPDIIPVELDNFPGGSPAFELLARYCHYNGGKRENSQAQKKQGGSAEYHNVDDSHADDINEDGGFITASNVAILHCAGEFLEMTEHHCENNLIPQAEAFLASMPNWSVRQCIRLLNGCNTLPQNAWTSCMVHKCIDCIVSKVPSCSNSDHSTFLCSSPESRHSMETQNPLEAYAFSCLYHDITLLALPMMEKVVATFIAHHVESKFLAKCLLHYLQSAKVAAKGSGKGAQESRQCEILEVVVKLLYKLEWESISCKSLFGLQRLASSLLATKPCRKHIEDMIGSQLHRATLDNILVPSRHHHNGSLYDVNLILRLVKKFLQRAINSEHGFFKTGSLQMLADLLDMYLAEIAPDPCLSPSKFKAVAECLPDHARDSHDELYRALDIYLEAHSKIEEGEAMEVCKVISFHKLSMEASKHVAQSLRFPARLTLQVLQQEQSSLKATINVHRIMKRCGSSLYHTPPSSLNDSHSSHNNGNSSYSNSNSNSNSNRFHSSSSSSCSSGSGRCLYEQLGMDPPDDYHEYAQVLRQNDELRTDLYQMQARMVELEKACSQMKSKVCRYMKTKHLIC